MRFLVLNSEQNDQSLQNLTKRPYAWTCGYGWWLSVACSSSVAPLPKPCFYGLRDRQSAHKITTTSRIRATISAELSCTNMAQPLLVPANRKHIAFQCGTRNHSITELPGIRWWVKALSNPPCVILYTLFSIASNLLPCALDRTDS